MTRSQYNRKPPKYDVIIWDGTNEVAVRDFCIDAATWYQMMDSDPILSTQNDDGSLTVADNWGYVNVRVPLNGYISCGPYWLDPMAEGARGSNTLEFGPAETLAAKYVSIPGTATEDPLPPGGSVDYHDGGASSPGTTDPGTSTTDPATTDPGTSSGTEPAGSTGTAASDATTGGTATTGTDTPATDTSAPTDATAPNTGTTGTDATPSTDTGGTAPA